ncbi:replication protein A 14 kDa subunit [Maylandia zebra]|uniref:Replication protein A3 n=2 Tax=Haplochromini TaxID=319058 RepID=A0A3P9CNB6_9CICH|nr:replication protein A 14 kDa subunit [Maylandia zebra]XP_026012383.1 replication protein A 14 kDa subunit [Astatotilapia calliptera]XP_039858552.1 replication protein A 14 kDa subunit [Simochromis diagramma]
MASLLDASKPRINCSMLSQHIGRGVCFVGRVEKVHPTGKTFSVSDGEGKSATVELNEPLEEELSGIVEVIGMVSSKGVITTTTYNILREDKGIPFDLELYNEALKVIHDFPQYYPFEVAASG